MEKIYKGSIPKEGIITNNNVIIKKCSDEEFEHFINDGNISLKAKGIYIYLRSKEKSWKFSIGRIARENKEGIDSVRSGIQELEKYGYITRKNIKQR